MARIQDPIFRIRRPRNIATSKIISGAILGGSVIAAAAIVWPTSSRSERVTTEVIPVAAPAPVQEARVEAPVVVETVEQTEPVAIESEKVVVALMHDDTETDYAKLAEEQMDAGDVTKAFVSLRKHIAKNEPTAELLIQIGRFGRQIGENAIAEQALLDAAALDPKNVDTQLELARVMMEVGELDQARFHARQAIRLDADSALAWNTAGRIAMQQSHWDRAEASLRRAVELDPLNAMFHNNLGLLYIYTRRADDAVDSMETAIEMFDADAPYFAYNNLGLAHEMAGHLDEAAEAFEQALVVNPTYARARVNLDRVNGAIAARDEKRLYDTASGPESTTDEDEKSLRP